MRRYKKALDNRAIREISKTPLGVVVNIFLRKITNDAVDRWDGRIDRMNRMELLVSDIINDMIIDNVKVSINDIEYTHYIMEEDDYYNPDAIYKYPDGSNVDEHPIEICLIRDIITSMVYSKIEEDTYDITKEVRHMHLALIQAKGVIPPATRGAMFNNMLNRQIASIHDMYHQINNEFVDNIRNSLALLLVDEVNINTGISDEDEVLEVKKLNPKIEKIFDWKKLESLALSNGYEYRNSNGDHRIYIHKKTSKMIVIIARTMGLGLSIQIQKRIYNTEV